MTTKRNKKYHCLFLGFFVFSVLLFLLLPILGNNFGLVSALEVPLPGLGDNPTLPEYIAYFVNKIMKGAVILSLLVITFGGIHWLVSLGMGKIISEGKEWLKAGILGLVLLLCSYLILYTINPELVSLKITSKFPFLVIPTINPPGGSSLLERTIITFEEIPIGTLTETLLTRTVNCYEFDKLGGPIDNDPQTPELEPLLNHDRVNCILNLAEAIERKAKILNDLSLEIITLMRQCNCSGICRENCAAMQQGDCFFPGPNISPSPCRPPEEVGTNKPCNGSCKNSTCNGPDPCPDGIKEQIENGPIYLSNCNIDQSLFVANCQTECVEKHPYEDPNQCLQRCIIENGIGYKGLNEFRSQYTSSLLPVVEKEITINNEKVKIIEKEVWKNLRLVDKIKYLKEKISEFKNGFEEDLGQLELAENKMEDRYFTQSYLGFLRFVEKSKKNPDSSNAVEIKTIKTFQDKTTGEKIDISKYCKGFEYSNSECFHSCQKMCDPINEITQNCLINNAPICQDNNEDCLKEQKNKVIECIDKSPCPSYNFPNFQECLVSCRDECSDDCEKKYSADCPEEIEQCKEKCQKNSESILFNLDKCYLYPKGLRNCAQETNFEKFQNCANNVWRCKYCTDQYAGYPDCLKEPLKPTDSFSSLYFLQNSSRQKCSQCYRVINEKTGKIEYSGIEQYPECSKCPPCSNCPKCPFIECDKKFAACEQKCEGKQECLNSCNRDRANCVKNNGIDESLIICTTQCAEFAYNDDPLTFYAPKSIWKGEEIAGIPYKLENEYDPGKGSLTTCPAENQIPVGQTVDGAENWAESLIKAIDNLVQKTEETIAYIKKIAEEENYCKCDSKCNDNENACGADCIYSQTLVPLIDAETGAIIRWDWLCDCALRSCSGNSCQKMINLLMGKAKDAPCPKDTEYKGIPSYYREIRIAVEELRKKIDGRSDILKKLIYSRKKMDECSGRGRVFKNEIISFTCQRRSDEVLPSTSTPRQILYIDASSPPSPSSPFYIYSPSPAVPGCYGNYAGQVLQKPLPLLDDWECCEIKN